MLPHQIHDGAAASTGPLQLGSGHAQGTRKVKQNDGADCLPPRQYAGSADDEDPTESNVLR